MHPLLPGETMDIIPIQLERDMLHTKFGGGIPSNSLVIIEGENGAGKSIMAQRLTYGMIRHGSKVSFISSECDTIGFVNQMRSLDYDIEDDILDENLIFMSLFPSLGNVTLRSDFSERLMKSNFIFKNDVIIFDTMSYILVHKNLPDDKCFEVIKFLKRMNNHNKTIILCIDAFDLNEKFLNVLRSISDVYLHVETKMSLGNLIRVVNIKRFKRCADVVGSVVPFNVAPKIGFRTIIESVS